MTRDQELRWRPFSALPLSATHLARRREVVQHVLSVAEGLKSQAIARILERGDEELALGVLTGKLKR